LCTFKWQALFQHDWKRCLKVIFLNCVIRLHPKGSLDSDAGKHVQDKSYFPLRQGLPCASLSREDSGQLDSWGLQFSKLYGIQTEIDINLLKNKFSLFAKCSIFYHMHSKLAKSANMTLKKFFHKI
jgi:hypothetical protein